MDNLKDYREKELKMYAIVNIIVILLLLGVFKVEELQNNSYELISKIFTSSIMLAGIYIFSFLSDSLFSSGLKRKLLYFDGHLFKEWGFMPGEHIFSLIKNNNQDLRFTTTQALNAYQKIYIGIPQDEDKRRKYENSCWFKIYGKYRDDPMIFFSNRDSLLCRDLYISTISMLFAYVFLSVIVGMVLNWHVILYLVVMIGITNICAHIKAKRFVFNVIARDLQNYK